MLNGNFSKLQDFQIVLVICRLPLFGNIRRQKVGGHVSIFEYAVCGLEGCEYNGVI